MKKSKLVLKFDTFKTALEKYLYSKTKCGMIKDGIKCKHLIPEQKCCLVKGV